MMNRCAGAVLAIVAAACGKGSGTTHGAPAGPPKPPSAGSPPANASATAPGAGSPEAQGAARCAPLPFAESTPVPEASGAAWLTIDGKPALVIVGDSGNRGAYGIIDPETGATLETGALPLSSEAGDDLEGISARGDKILGLTSSGWIRAWQRTSGGAPGSARSSGKGFELIEKPYPLGPLDLPRKKSKARAPRGDGMVCHPHGVNCGRNYEGLCIAPTPREGACIGFAAAKADGRLYCLTDEAGKLVVHHDRAIAITRPGALADCAFGDDNTLWAGSNLFDLGNVYRITGWEDPASAQVEPVAVLAIGFPELIAARGDVVYRMSDMGGAPSLMARYRCRR